MSRRATNRPKKPEAEAAGMRGMNAGAAALLKSLRERAILILCGGGGVGKTTLSAALALRAAAEGRKVLVLTIDPAHRLANALGMSSLGDEERRIAPEAFVEAGVPVPSEGGGELWASMLDAKRTFDHLIERYVADPAVRTRILTNPIYVHGSRALMGSPEYMAMEKLFELKERDRYDLIVMDTPPTQHAIDFLSAPGRMVAFLDENRLIRFLIAQAADKGRTAARVLHFATSTVIGIIDRIAGEGFLDMGREFLAAFESMFDGFVVRARRVNELLRAPGTEMMVVASPNSQCVREALFFRSQIERFRIPFGGFIVNRYHPNLAPKRAGRGSLSNLLAAEDGLARAAARMSGASPLVRRTALRLLETFARYQSVASSDETNMARLVDSTGRAHFLALVPFLDEEVSDLAGLWRMGESLFKAEPD